MKPVSAEWLTQLLDGTEYILTHDKTAEPAYVLDNLLADIRQAIEAAQASWWGR